eukprot:gene19914-22633_t
MIAERPKQQESSLVEVDLFEGLSFPEVPSAPVAVSNATQASFVTNPAPASKTLEVKQMSSPVSVVNKKEPIVPKAGNLSSLYATSESHEVYTSNAYPELPSLGSVMNGSELQEDRTQSNSYSAALDESESLLPKPSGSVMPYVTQAADPLYTPPGTIHSYNPYHQPVVETRDANHNNAIMARTTEASAAPDLISDLVTENSRLADEVANLRRILHQQQQQQFQQQQLSSQSASQSMSVTGVQITDATRPPEKGVKYVCCGGCRQWLVAPRDAQFVVCSTCESINNCNLAPADNTSEHNRENEQRALVQRNANQAAGSFWFLDCLSKGFT